MEKEIGRVRKAAPSVDVKEAVRIYYERMELSNADINAVFSGNIGSTRMRTLKRQAREQMIRDGYQTCLHNANHVYTVSAYKAWGLKIEDLERRLAKLKKLGFLTVEAEGGGGEEHA